LNRDEESRQKSPQIIKEERGQEAAVEAETEESVENLRALGQMENIAAGGLASDPVEIGHKFGLPTLPIPSPSNMKHRYDPVVTQITNLLMKDGKKSVAQRVGPLYFTTT
jgi:small subunit ribosomal protein S7